MNVESLKVFCQSIYKKINNREVVFMIAKDMLKREGYKLEELNKKKFLNFVLGPQYYNVDYIAFRVGLRSTSPIMRNKAIIEIVKQIKLEPWEFKNDQYTESVISNVIEWIIKNNYPEKIPWISRNGKKHYYKVQYLNKDQQNPCNSMHAIRIFNTRNE